LEPENNVRLIAHLDRNPKKEEQMAIRHTVQIGDSLWSLSHRYLGSGTRYQEIVDEHNKEAARFGQHSRLLPINDPNLIFVGQTIMVPPRKNNPQPGTGKRHEAKDIAAELGLKMEYNFEEGKNPVKYKPMVTKDYTITTEMTGKIAIENLTHNGARHNFEIAMAIDKNELSSKLEFGDKALAELTKNVEPKFDVATGKVTLKASIAAHANIGPYVFDVELDAPNHLKATYKPQPIKAIVEKGRRRYKYSAEIAFKIDITLHPSIHNEKPQTKPKALEKQVPNHSGDSTGPLTAVGIIVAYIIFLIYGPKVLPRTGGPLRYSPTLRTPFLHDIDPNDPRLRA
jgi:hypothetical protein